MFKKCPVFFLLSSDGVPVDCVPVIMGNVSGPVLFGSVKIIAQNYLQAPAE